MGVSKSFEDLYAQLSQIAVTRPEGSGTLERLRTPECTPSARRSSKRPPRSGWRPGTESTEAAAEEMSQLIYHVQTMMVKLGLTPDDIYRYL